VVGLWKNVHRFWAVGSTPGNLSEAEPVFKTGQVLRLVLSDYFGMKKKDLTLQQSRSVPCPTCGVAAGDRCLLHSGGLRSSPHVNRKLAAIEAIETKRTPRS
jgi:hypothetical protein